MYRAIINLILILIFSTIFPSISLSLEEKSATCSPVAFLPSEAYNFDPVLEGEKVTHDFIIENKGSALLQIFSVKTSCGCTAAFWSKEIPPGAKGNISLSLNTKGYGGKSIQKTARVETNDPDNMTITLTLSGDVEAYAKIEPARAVLSGAAGSDIKAEIKIIPNKKFPFRITGMKNKGGENISLDLRKITDEGGSKYLLSVINLRKTPGKYSDNIFLTTDSALKPDIEISVSGEIR